MVSYRIAYENAVASRHDLERMYDASVKSGSLIAPEDDAIVFAQKFKDLHGKTLPRCGWAVLAKELRLIELACGPMQKSGLTAATVRAKVEKAMKRLAEGQALLKELEYQLDYVAAILSLTDHYALRAREDSLKELVQDLVTISNSLDANKPPKKWTATSMRQHRVRLAVLLKPLFEEHFAAKARPVPGSAAVDDADSNDWTRFYQMAASMFLDENATPDRQAVLWEANRQPLALS